MSVSSLIAKAGRFIPIPLVLVILYLVGITLCLISHSRLVIAASMFFAAIAALMATVSNAHTQLRLASMAVVFLCLGLSVGAIRLDSLGDSRLSGFRAKQIEAEVTVSKMPKENSGKMTFIGHAEIVEANGVRYAADEAVLVEVFCRQACSELMDSGLEEGKRVRVKGTVEDPPSVSGSDFDYGLYLRRRGINAVIAVGEGQMQMLPGSRDGWRSLVDGLRHRARESLGAGNWGAAGALFQGMVLGDTEQVPEEVVSDFRDSGLLHLLAVSGQNVVLLAFIVTFMCQAFGLHRLVSVIVSSIVIAAYVPLTGADPSIVRAGIVGLLGLAAYIVSRPVDRYHFLAVSAAVILTINPYSLFDPGFQLSYAAVLAIFLLAPAVSKALTFLPGLLLEPVAISIATGIATAPILLYHFHQVPLVTVPANVAAAPAAAPVMLLGVLAVAAAPLGGAAAWLINAAASVCTGYLIAVARFFAAVPGAVYHTNPPGLIWISVFYAMLALAVAAFERPGIVRFMKRRLSIRIWMPAVFALATVLMIGFACSGSNGGQAPADFTVSFLDVGQGDAGLIQVPGGATILIDGGHGPEIVKQLKRNGVKRLDAIILTHPHFDHLGGLESVLNEFDVDRFYDAAPETSSPEYRDLLKLVENKQVSYGVLRRGQRLDFGELELDVLSPGDYQPSDDANAGSIVAVTSYRGLDILFTGDAEGEVLLPLELRQVEVLKVSHHGSRDNYLDKVLQRIKPDIAVISVGEGNEYGHPDKGTLDKLNLAGVKIYRTDENGTVKITLAGNEVEVQTGQ